MYARSITSLLFVIFISAAAVMGFSQQPRLVTKAPTTSTTAVYGIFDMMKKSMESGYAGGDDSPYAKIKEQDRKREEIRKRKAEERKRRGFKELKDVKERTYVKLTYQEPDEPEEEKKFFGLF